MPAIQREIVCNFYIIRPFHAEGRKAGAGKLAKSRKFEQTRGMSLVRTMYAIMASRKKVLLSDGRTGVITRVDTSFPGEETTVEVWMKGAEGPGLAKVNAKTVTALSPKKTA
jgi:hypothetical protein